MPIQFLKDLSKIEKFYNISDTIDPELTAVILHSESLADAVLNYTKKSKDSRLLPTFIILDMDAGAITDTNIINLVKKFKLNIIPIMRKDKISQKQFCFYTKPEFYKELKLVKMREILRVSAKYYNIKDNFLIDISVFDQPSPPPMRVDFVDSRMEDIVRIYRALNDDLSRECFLRLIKFLKTGITCYLSPALYAQYEHPLVKAEVGDYIIEGGLDSGDTTLRFLELIGSTGHIYAFEPLQKAYDKTKKLVSKYDNATIEHYGLFSKSMKFYVTQLGCSSYLVEEAADNTEKCHAITIDDYARRNINKCDMIKLDIEGAEIECLKGAEDTINKFYPKLQISLYHRPPTQYLEIPLMILDNYPDYQLYFGHHCLWVWETMLYAIKK